MRKHNDRGEKGAPDRVRQFRESDTVFVMKYHVNSRTAEMKERRDTAGAEIAELRG